MSYSLFPDQKEFQDGIRAAWRRKHKWVLGQACTGSGKCLGKDTPVLMFNGSIKKVQDIVSGDKLMGPDSKPRNVSSICSGVEKLYEITPTKGDSWICNESHILSLRKTNSTPVIGAKGYESRSRPKGHIWNISIKDYLNKSASFKHRYKQWRVSVLFEESKQPISPYFIGIWLGDGSSASTSITSMDIEVIDEFEKETKLHGLSIRIEKAGGKSSTYKASSGKSVRKNSLLQEMRKLNLINNKHIPDIYKVASRDQRLELLAGLMDTDGSLSGGCFDYISKIERLSNEVAFVARSLGFSAYVKKCSKTCGNNGISGFYYRVSISGDIGQIPCKIKKKKASFRKQKKDVLNTGFKIKDVGEGEYFGFEIDGDSLFLLGDFTVTHNTAVATDLICASRDKGKRIGFMVPRKDLLEQTSRTFEKHDLVHSFVAAGKPYNPYSRIYLGMMDTMDRRIPKGTLPKLDLLIVDEAHFGDGALDRVIAHYQAQGAWGLGLSATPWHISGRGLKRWYSDMVCGKSMRWLIDNKRLSDYTYFGGRTKLDLDKVKRDASGEYNESHLASYMEEQGKIIGDCVEDYRTRAMGRLFVVRCTSIKHSQRVAQKFRDGGIPAMHVDGDTPIPERRRIFIALARRELLVVTFATLLNFGFDLSQITDMDVTIDGQTDLRPCGSLASQMQWWGRALRWKPYNAIINDCVNNWVEHGFPCDEREWTLEDRDLGEGGERATPLRQCTNCWRPHNPAPVCPNCGYVYPINERGGLQHADGEMEEIDFRAMRRTRADLERRTEELIRLATSRGVKDPVRWAAKKITEEMKGLTA